MLRSNENATSVNQTALHNQTALARANTSIPMSLPVMSRYTNPLSWNNSTYPRVEFTEFLNSFVVYNIMLKFYQKFTHDFFAHFASKKQTNGGRNSTRDRNRWSNNGATVQDAGPFLVQPKISATAIVSSTPELVGEWVTDSDDSADVPRSLRSQSPLALSARRLTTDFLCQDSHAVCNNADDDRSRQAAASVTTRRAADARNIARNVDWRRCRLQRQIDDDLSPLNRTRTTAVAGGPTTHRPC